MKRRFYLTKKTLILSFLVLILSHAQICPRIFVNPIVGDNLTDLLKKMGKTICEIRCSAGEIIKEPTTIYDSGALNFGAA